MTDKQRETIANANGKMLLDLYISYHKEVSKGINEEASEIFSAIQNEIIKRCDSVKEDSI